MLIDFVDLIGKNIEVEMSRDIFLKGTLLDSGLDIIVMYDARDQHFLYIPIVHVQMLKETILDKEDPSYQPPSERPIETDLISFRKALMIAKGLFVQVYVTGNKSIHGLFNQHYERLFCLSLPCVQNNVYCDETRQMAYSVSTKCHAVFLKP